MTDGPCTVPKVGIATEWQVLTPQQPPALEAVLALDPTNLPALPSACAVNPSINTCD